MPCWMIVVCAVGQAVPTTEDGWAAAERHGRQSQQAIRFCGRYAHGWLTHADPATGLLPRSLRGEDYWNAKDCAADNYPFLVITAYVTGDYHLKRAARDILEQEQRRTNRLDRLPDDFLFGTQSFRPGKPKLEDLIFGAAEYAKDGLIPITEWTGPGPWLARLENLIRDVWNHATIESKFGRIPTSDVEVAGDLLEAMSRLYWLTGNDEYRTWTFRLADHYLLEEDLAHAESLRLRDHGSEIMGGLSEAYLIASRTDADRWHRYRPVIHRLFDRVLEIGRNDDGLLFNLVSPRTGEIKERELIPGWGYVYNAYLTVAGIDNDESYRRAVERVLGNVHKYRSYGWGRLRGEAGADDYADVIEGTIYLLNRIPVPSAFDWVDGEIQHIFGMQRPDGIIEGWYGDGNSARTAILYALWKTQGVTASPWPEDVQLGAVRQPDGSLLVSIKTEWTWEGRLCFDHVRHRDTLHLPVDYPRINQFPEWFTVEPNARYVFAVEGSDSRVLDGAALQGPLLKPKAGRPLHIRVRKAPPGT